MIFKLVKCCKCDRFCYLLNFEHRKKINSIVLQCKKNKRKSFIGKYLNTQFVFKKILQF